MTSKVWMSMAIVTSGALMISLLVDTPLLMVVKLVVATVGLWALALWSKSLGTFLSIFETTSIWGWTKVLLVSLGCWAMISGFVVWSMLFLSLPDLGLLATPTTAGAMPVINLVTHSLVAFLILASVFWTVYWWLVPPVRTFNKS